MMNCSADFQMPTMGNSTKSIATNGLVIQYP